MSDIDTLRSYVEALRSLHTRLIDSRNGYEEALEDAKGRSLSPLFREMIALRDHDAGEVAAHLAHLGIAVDDRGSFMSAVNRTVMTIRSMFARLDESMLPSLIEGEERILDAYDEVIKQAPVGSMELSTLTRQREILGRRVRDMKVRNDMAA